MKITLFSAIDDRSLGESWRHLIPIRGFAAWFESMCVDLSRNNNAGSPG